MYFLISRFDSFAFVFSFFFSTVFFILDKCVRLCKVALKCENDYSDYYGLILYIYIHVLFIYIYSYFFYDLTRREFKIPGLLLFAFFFYAILWFEKKGMKEKFTVVFNFHLKIANFMESLKTRCFFLMFFFLNGKICC